MEIEVTSKGKSYFTVIIYFSLVATSHYLIVVYIKFFIRLVYFSYLIYQLI